MIKYLLHKPIATSMAILAIIIVSGKRGKGAEEKTAPVSEAVVSATEAPETEPEPPRSVYAEACRPISVPFLIASRIMAPVDTVGIPSRAEIRSAWVPFPAPGAPRKITFIRFTGAYSKKPL